MPSPTVMRARAKQLDESIGRPKQTEEEKEEKRKQKEKSSKFTPIILAILFFVVIGSSVLQIFQHIQLTPSMSVEH